MAQQASLKSQSATQALALLSSTPVPIAQVLSLVHAEKRRVFVSRGQLTLTGLTACQYWLFRRKDRGKPQSIRHQSLDSA